MRAKQTVSEMVVESLAGQAQALSERSGRPFEEAFEEELKTPAGHLLTELADGPHRHEKAAGPHEPRGAESLLRQPGSLFTEVRGREILRTSH